jgi:peptide/nickel transport system permease protein
VTGLLITNVSAERIDSSVAEQLRRFTSVGYRGAVGIALLSFLVLFVVFVPLFLRNPTAIDPSVSLQPPSGTHLLGTDLLGRDILARVANGGRRTLLLAAIAVGVGLLGGFPLGGVGALDNRIVDRTVVLILDSLLAFPSILVALLVVTALGPGLVTAGVAIGVAWIPYFGRIIRSQVMSVRTTTYVTAARAGGARPLRILFGHIAPNAFPPLIVLIAFAISESILIGAGLGFLGLGAQPPDPEWGSLLSAGRDFLTVAPWLVLFPSIMILISSLTFTLLADAMQDHLDPKRRIRGQF